MSELNTPTAPAEALAGALTAEYAAIWAYGPIGVRLSGAERKAAAEAEAAHRSRRDALVVHLSAAGGGVPPDRPGYALPFPVTDRASALRLAVQVEERTAAFWRAALPASTGADRDRALAALVEYAVRATRWRRSAGTTPITVPFPGRPG
ncbi:ferritin-like domain-containing protein [Micromonospora sp. Llam7]|uniref:ferritin-like domain-containing protein n=1 Tax=Micromonospora tarapacensis TaxID=2835305 RepID=UPI001C839DDE|nr:ferritin-like domain-containing protein [Micromonospora tarapacensis]MBX7268426.1 ferritin-like domain-containing protein [Micromonospora tarapacensis]